MQLFTAKFCPLCAVFSVVSVYFPVRHPHNSKAVGSNPAPATKSPLISPEISGFSLFSELFEGAFSGAVWADPNGDPYGSESECGHTFAVFLIVLAQRGQPLKPALPLSP